MDGVLMVEIVCIVISKWAPALGDFIELRDDLILFIRGLLFQVKGSLLTLCEVSKSFDIDWLGASSQ